MPMGCIKCSREDLRQESPRPVERASRGRAGLLSNLQRDGDAIPKGNDRGDHPRVLRQPFVVGPDGLRLLRSVFAGHIAAPQDVVRDEESTNSEALDRGVQDRGISGLVDVVEDEVERTFEVLQNSLCIADENPDLRGDAGLLHVLPGNRRGLGIVLHSDKLAIVVERASEPRARVSDRGAEIEDPACADRTREDVKEASLRRGDDGPAFLFALLLHSPQRGVTSVRQAIDVLVDFLVYDAARHATTAATSVEFRYEPSRSLDKRFIPDQRPWRRGMGMCKLTKTDSAVWSLYLETQYVNEIMARGCAVPPNLNVPAPARSKLTGLGIPGPASGQFRRARPRDAPSSSPS